MPYYSPLRYPGGKRRLVTVVTRLLNENHLIDVEYAEPYAGGAAVALALLMDGHASAIHLNDLSRPVYAFWHTVLHNTAVMCERVLSTPITMEEWYRQREVFKASDAASLEDLGFATLFLNRTNRSGILSGGVIGGKHQTGAWRLDARFGKSEIVRRIQEIGNRRSHIHLHHMDAYEFVTKVLNHMTAPGFAFFDPPYIESGDALYMNNYTTEAHSQLAEAVQELSISWICTYDRAAVRLGLYETCRRIEYQLPYMAQGRHQGDEVMFVSPDLLLPCEWTDSKAPVRLTHNRDRYALYGSMAKGSMAK